jgi:hypothetical protein
MVISFYILYFVLAFVVSLSFTLLEIQIEGKDGWAKNLPTWRKKFGFTKWIPGADKELTGYHFYLWLFILLILHSAFLVAEWTLKSQLIILSFYVLILRLEDFLWFVLNPDFGLKRFNKKSIPWHKDWFGPFPTQYYLSIFMWAILFFYAIGI